jgi:hypothetical protein
VKDSVCLERTGGAGCEGATVALVLDGLDAEARAARSSCVRELPGSW